MYVLVFAPTGTVGEDGSYAEVYKSYNEAWFAMDDDVKKVIREEDFDPGDCSVDEWHATACLSCSDSPEWHIYEA